jgi:hypothetical protein
MRGPNSSPAFEESLERDGAVVLLVSRGVDKGDGAAFALASENVDDARSRSQFFPIFPLEPLPPLGIMAEPFAQSGARRNVLQPKR